ncbi:PhaM family polyhydroxyalkanoate granule multifunctional regulatory protein, partial [Mycetohabitans sp. B6]
MSDSGGNTPFSSFPRFSPNAGDEMFDSLLKLMRMPGGLAGDGGLASPPLGLGPDIGAPLMSVEELDKRITDLRAVEQWLKLNLSMLQSTIQALQMQRSTLATLRAFGAFAQASMTPTPGGASGTSPPSGECGISGDARGAPWPPPAAAGQADEADGGEGAAGATGAADAAQFAAGEALPQWDASAAHGTQAAQAGESVAKQQGPDAQDGAPADRRAPDTSRGEAADAAAAADAGERAAASRAGEPLDASAWWSWLQTQFEQIARFAVAPHTMPGASVPADDIEEAMRQR